MMANVGQHPAEKARQDYVDSRAFWDGIENSALVLQYCPQVDAYQHYPRPVSVYTGTQQLMWREVDTGGVIYALTQGVIAGSAAGSDKKNVDIALVELDVGVRLLSIIDIAEGQTVEIGDRVRVCWLDHPDGYKYYAFRPEVRAV